MVAYTYTMPNASPAVDFLLAGQTLTTTYNVTVTDQNGASSTQAVNFTLAGTTTSSAAALYSLCELRAVRGDSGVCQSNGDRSGGLRLSFEPHDGPRRRCQRAGRLPSALNIAGTSYSSFFINNNGLITLAGALDAFTPLALRA